MRSNQFLIRGKSPRIDSSCYVAATAVVSGDVTIGPGTVVLHGAILTAESAPIVIGSNCVIMECAVVRGAGKHQTVIEDCVLVGPHAHITGAHIARETMIATQAVVFNGASIGRGSLVAIGAIVHIGTRLPEGGRVPMQHIAIGDPVQIFSADKSTLAHQMIAQIGFTKTVFDYDTSHLTFDESMAWVCQTYAAALRKHGNGESSIAE